MRAVTDATFTADVLQSDKPVLVDFWAEWCVPCRKVNPLLEEIANEMGDKVSVVKVDIDANPATTQAYQIMSVPTLTVFKGGQPVQSIDGARWRLGQRSLYQAVAAPLFGDDVRQLQERLLEMGYDIGRADAVYGGRTARAVARFQREVGLAADGACGPQTMNALRRLGRKVVGGRPQMLRETAAFHASGPALVGKRIVIDPGH